MIPLQLLPLSVTWQQPGDTTDEYNNIVDDWSGGTDIAAYIEQQNTVEKVDGRDVVSSRLLFMTNELGVTAGDRIIWNDDAYTIDGDAFVFQTPNGPHHLEATLLKVTG